MDGATAEAIANRISGKPGAWASTTRVCRRIVVLLAVVIGAGLSSSRAAAQSTCPAGFAQFTCPTTPSDVVIDHPMCLEADCVFHNIRIESGGELRVPDETQKVDAKKIKISARRIIVKAGGFFQVGPLTNNRLTLTLTGAPPAEVVTDRDARDDPCPSAHFDKGIEICGGATLNLLGNNRNPSDPEPAQRIVKADAAAIW